MSDLQRSLLCFSHLLSDNLLLLLQTLIQLLFLNSEISCVNCFFGIQLHFLSLRIVVVGHENGHHIHLDKCLKPVNNNLKLLH